MSTFAQALTELWPNSDAKIAGLRDGMIETAPAVFQRYGIKTPLLIAHVMAQISHECGAGSEVVENLNYSSARLLQVWPKHFNSSNVAIYANNPQKLANFIYNPPQHTDLGNQPYSQDGWTYRGRGASQTTGRAGYARLATATGLDLLSKPELVNDPRYFMLCGVADFILCGCLPYAVADDIVGVTKKLNGGTVGLDQRRAWLAKWKAANVQPSNIIILPTTPRPLPPDVPAPIPAPKPASGFAAFISAILNAIAAIFKRSK